MFISAEIYKRLKTLLAEILVTNWKVVKMTVWSFCKNLSQKMVINKTNVEHPQSQVMIRFDHLWQVLILREMKFGTTEAHLFLISENALAHTKEMFHGISTTSGKANTIPKPQAEIRPLAIVINAQ